MSFFVQVLLNGDYHTAFRGRTLEVIGSLPSGQREVLFRGVNDDAMRYPDYLAACRRWLCEDGIGPVPTFSRRDGQYERVQCPMSFQGRVEFAAARMREQDTYHRAVDACFEMGDGDKVVWAIMRMAKEDPFLRRGIEAMGPAMLEDWRKTEKSGGGMPLLACC